MQTRLFFDLEKAIVQWADENSRRYDWPDIILGNQTLFHMAKAAESVFDAISESQAYGKREGLFGND